MDEKKRLLVASSSSSSGAMEKQGIGGVEKQQQEQQPPVPVVQLGQSKCPRCDSSNTKFCYYNNYSLSQPRHFCKACKRYWTRGGTLRNVPVGGGCRKNKRLLKIIRPSVTTTTDRHQVLASTNNHIANPMLLSGASSRLSTSRVVEEAIGGLGFSSAGQLVLNGHDFLHNYYSSCSSVMTSMVTSTIEDKKFTISTGGDLQLKDDSSGLSTRVNKLVQGRQINYNMINYPFGNGIGGWNNYLGYQMEEQQVIGTSSTTTDPANYCWSSMSNANATPSNNWHDPPPANTHESPVPSFI